MSSTTIKDILHITMVDACGNRIRGPPGWDAPFRKLCVTPAFSTTVDTPTGSFQDTTFTPCVSSNIGLEKPGKSTPMGLPVRGAISFTPLTGNAMVPQGTALSCDGILRTTTVQGQGLFGERQQDVVPVPVADSVARNCRSALKTVWQCDRFLARNDLDGYNKCRAEAECFQYDTVMPDGSTVPIAVRNTPMCRAAAVVALKQCGNQCGRPARTTCVARPPWH